MNILSDQQATDLNYSTAIITCFAGIKILTHLILPVLCASVHKFEHRHIYATL